MRTLGIDIETYSSADLKKTGVYKYVEAPDFEILLFAYSIDGAPAMCVDLASGEHLPEEVAYALEDPTVLLTAHNAAFERPAINRHFGLAIPADRWECTMVKASMLGLPLSLDQVGKALKLPTEKDAAGKALIKYFCVPCKPTKTNGGRTRNLPEHAPEKWERFKAYCARDVDQEQAVRNKISFFNIPATEQRLYQLDQKINDAGILLDHTFVKRAVNMDIAYRERLTAEAIALTGLDNPNSAAQLKAWLSAETDTEITTLRKADIPDLLKVATDDTVKRVLRIRQELAKTSVKKYIAMHNAVCMDSRVRGLLQFYGANRTGRWAGRLVQVQNLPRNEMEALDIARRLVREGDLEMLEMLFGNVPDVLSQLIRTAFIAPKGSLFFVADFSAIEARVIAWLAGERWRLDVFNSHGKIYEASAAQMFKVPIESITKGSDLRQRGKVAELALGYQGGVNALIAMGAVKMGVPEEELPALVGMWRLANKKIVQLWADVEQAALTAVRDGVTTSIQHGIKFFTKKGILFIQLPSGRCLSYMKASIKKTLVVYFKYDKQHKGTAAGATRVLPVPLAEALEAAEVGHISGEPFMNYALLYEGMDQTSKKWGQQETYGGKLVENIVQAIARDCLADAMLRLDAAGYGIVMHVHDEVVIEVERNDGWTKHVDEIMGTPIPWAPGLPLKAESYETEYYKKD